MVRENLLSEIADGEAKILATESSQTFSKEYKDRTVAVERAAIIQKHGEIAEYDRITDQSKG